MSIEASTYWSKSYPAQAVRLTKDNIVKIADYIGADYYEHAQHGPYIRYLGDEGYLGEWLVQEKEKGELYYLLSHEAFMKKFETHSERMSRDEKYATVFNLVCNAMLKQDMATYHQDGQGEMELVAIDTTKKILEKLR